MITLVVFILWRIWKCHNERMHNGQLHNLRLLFTGQCKTWRSTARQLISRSCWIIVIKLQVPSEARIIGNGQIMDTSKSMWMEHG